MVSSIAYAVNNHLNAFSDSFSDTYILPGLKNAYLNTGEYIVESPHFSDETKKWVAEYWLHPIPTWVVLKVTGFVKPHLLKLSTSSPSQIRGTHFLHQSFAGIAQSLYPQLKEVNFFSKIPLNLINYATKFSFDNLTKWVATFNGKFFVYINNTYLFSKRILLTVLDWIIKIIDAALQTLTINPSFEYLGYLKEIIKAAKAQMDNKFLDVAIKTIENRENDIRKKITAAVSDYVSDYTVKTCSRVALKTLVFGSLYFGLLVPALENTVQIRSMITHVFGAIGLGTLIWKTTMRPFLEPYYDSYSKNFNPTHSSLREFCNYYNYGNLYPVVKVVKDFFKKTKYLPS